MKKKSILSLQVEVGVLLVGRKSWIKNRLQRIVKEIAIEDAVEVEARTNIIGSNAKIYRTSSLRK